MNYELKDNIAVITFDNGKVNAVNPTFMTAMHQYLDQAEEEASAVILTGHEGMFSAGYDLKILQADREVGLAMINDGLKMLNRLYAYPKPLVAACDGHAIGLGAFILMSCDTRIGSDETYNVTLPETAISMPFGDFLLELATARIAREEHTKRILQSVPCDPKAAVKAGFLDDVVPRAELMETAMQVATELSKLPPKFYASNKLDLRKHSLAKMANALSVEAY